MTTRQDHMNAKGLAVALTLAIQRITEAKP